jgi:hypothetical protein
LLTHVLRFSERTIISPIIIMCKVEGVCGGNFFSEWLLKSSSILVIDHFFPIKSIIYISRSISHHPLSHSVWQSYQDLFPIQPVHNEKLFSTREKVSKKLRQSSFEASIYRREKKGRCNWFFLKIDGARGENRKIV